MFRQWFVVTAQPIKSKTIKAIIIWTKRIIILCSPSECKFLVNLWWINALTKKNCSKLKKNKKTYNLKKKTFYQWILQRKFTIKFTINIQLIIWMWIYWQRAVVLSLQISNGFYWKIFYANSTDEKK